MFSKTVAKQGIGSTFDPAVLPDRRCCDTPPLPDILSGQDYIFTAPVDNQFIPYQQNQNQYIRPSDIIPFRQSPAGFQPVDVSSTYLPRELHPHDLQTSDLPLHLQQTLPQYRFTTNEPFLKNVSPLQYNFQNNHSPVNRVVNTPVGFRPSQSIRPTTLRPNYSHLFAKSHSHDPSQTETFLGQITLQNPIETPPQFDEFKPSEAFPQKTQEITSNAFAGIGDDGRTNIKLNENSIQLGGRSSFLNHRTRIFAPDTSKKTTRTQVKDYFVNNNGDVYITTKIPFSPKPTTPTHVPSTTARRNNFNPATNPTGKPLTFNLKSDKKAFLPKNANPMPLKSVDLEPLLEEPIKEHSESNNDDDVEVIQSSDNAEITDAPTTIENVEKQRQEIKHQNISTAANSTSNEGTSDQNTSSDYIPETVTKAHNLELATLRDDKTEYDTGKPLDYNFSEELYDVSDGRESNENDIQDEYPENSGEILNDNKEKELEDLKEEPAITTTQKNESSYEVITIKPTTMMKESNFHDFIDTVEIDTTEAQSLFETTTIPMTVSMSSSVNIKKGGQMVDVPELEPELVISVVTSKTVVNNTVVASATPIPTVTDSVKPTMEPSAFGNEENTTDTWVVVASVQTSRSVSGARYLPSSIVEQEERVKLLNEHSNEEDASSQEDYSSVENYNDSEGNNNTSNEETTIEEKDTTILPTSTKPRTSTESLIDKLDRVQSDLSSGVLTGGLGNNIALIKENMPEKMDMTTMVDVGITTSTTTKAPYPQVNIRKFSPANRPSTTRRPKNGVGPKARYQNDRRATTQSSVDVNEPQSDQPQQKLDISSLLPSGYKLKGSDDKSSRLLQEILGRVKTPNGEEKTESTNGVDISKFLPPGYKLPKDEEDTTEASIFKNTKADDISKFLPPGYTTPKSEENTTEGSIFKNTKADDISKFLPPGYALQRSEEKTTEDSVFKNTKADDVSKFLPSGYKLPQSEEKTTEGSIFKNTKADDVSKFLPPGYKLPKSAERTTESSVFKNTKADDVSKFLPPGYKLPKSQSGTTESSIFKNTKADDVSKFLPPGYRLPRTTTTRKPKEAEPSVPNIKPVNDIGALLPPGYKPPKEESPNGLNPQPLDINAFLPSGYKPNTTESQDLPINLPPPDSSDSGSPSTPKPAGGFKVVFPSRPGGGARKSASRTTTRSSNEEQPGKPTVPTIHKGWPSRATTEFTGWPTPSTTPISIEKLLEAARTASTSTTQTVETTISTTSTTTTTTTTTPRPTTPGVCVDECDLAGTIKLVGGAKWVPELLDRNTKEWQILANEVQTQLDDVFSSSPQFGKWYKKIRIDGFSEGSVLVDYLVELNDLGRTIDTQEVKKYFHESLDDALSKAGSFREGKALNESVKLDDKLSLGNFIVDPKYTEFIVLPKHAYPTVGYAENDVLLPQWAIAVIVIGLASLLFVIIFGVTVLVNRQKNAKKKTPTPLTEDMLNELNKNHMGGFDNYGADDLYNMEDVWNDRGYDHKPPKKRSNGSIHDNSMSNLYDSWRSEWNGYYYNAYYGNNPGSSHSGYGRRRSDYDTNF